MSDTVKITFEIEGVENSIDQLNDMGTAAKKTGGKVEEANKKAADSSKEASKELGFLGQGVQDVGDFAKKLGADFTNGFNGVKKFAQGLGLSAKASKGLAIGFAAIGIPLILMAVAALIDYFKNFEGGVKIVTTTMNVLGKVVGNITEAFTKLLSGDFTGFFSQLKETGNVVKDTIKNTDALFEAESKLAEMNKTQVIENAKLRNELELQQKVLEDNTISYEDKTAALQKIGVAEQQLLANAIALTKAEEQRLQASIALEKNFETRRQLEQELAGVQASLIEQQGDLERTRFDVDKKVRELDEERVAKAQEAAAKELEIRKAFFAQLTTLNQQLELSQIQDLTQREKRKLEIELENQIRGIEQSEFSEKQKAQLIGKLQEQFRVDQLARDKAQGEALAKLEEDRLKRLGALQNEIELLNAENQRERDVLALVQQEAAAMAELALVENNEALILATREKFRLLREEQDERFATEDDEKRLVDLEKEIENLMLGFQAIGNVTNAERQKQLGEANAYFDKLLADETLTVDQRIALEKQRGDVVGQVEDNIKAGQAASLDAVQGTINAIGSVLKEGSAAAKAFAVADAIINTYKAANLALASAPPPFGAILAAANVAAGIINVKKILSTKPGTTSVSAQTGPTSVPQTATPDISQVFRAAEAAAPSATEAATGRVQQSRMNQAGPIKAFVISGDVSNAQEADQKIQKLSKL